MRKMTKMTKTIWAMAVLSVTHAVAASAGDLSCDFEKGMPADWKISSSLSASDQSSLVAELAKRGENNAVLKLGSDARVTLGDQPLLNFTLEATLDNETAKSGSSGGFEFRNGYRVSFRKPGRIELTGPNGASSMGMNRGLDAPLRLKIVVAGPVVRFFVNDIYEGQFDQLAMTPGPVALFESGEQNNIYFDDVKLASTVDPANFLSYTAEPGADQDLVFDPAKDVNLKVTLRNFSDVEQRSALGVEVTTFDNKPVVKKTMAPTTVAANGSQTSEINLGRIPEGFYRITFQPTGETLPLAVHVKGTVTSDQITLPKILMGVYWYFPGQNLPPVWWNTYLHAAANDLRQNNFNTIICSMGMPSEAIAIMGQYGIRCFTRSEGVKGKAANGEIAKGNVADLNVIGGFIGDEPHEGQEERYIKDYSRLVKEYPDKEFTTCMIGDGGMPSFTKWWDTWTPLSPNNKIIPMFRWYGIKRGLPCIERPYADGPGFTEVLRGMSKYGKPYYVILPSFGKKLGIDSFYGNPLPSEIQCMMHLAAAFQAKGQFFFTYQNNLDGEAFVNEANLLPMDGKWAAAGVVAGQIEKNADLLAELKWTGRYPFVADAPSLLEVFTLKRENDQAIYYYVINTDTRKPAEGRLFKLEPTGKLRDLFNDRDVAITKETIRISRPGDTVHPSDDCTSGMAKISLAAGEGMLLKYTVDSTGSALPRVTFPDPVAQVPEENITWLAGVAPLEMPKPGWVEAIKTKGKKWYPDFNSKDLLLYSGPDDSGQMYKKSLYAHAETRIRYDIPADAVTFAAAAGFANKSDKSSAVFRVLVDGKEKFNSGVMKLGSPVQPVVVDITGGKILELVTEDGGDGLAGDYTFWGEARLIRK